MLNACRQPKAPVEETTRITIDESKYPMCSEISQKTEYDNYFEGKEFAERLILAGEVSAVLEDLEKSHQKFISSGDLNEVFPVLLYHKTKSSFEIGLTPVVKHKIEYMRIILRTYDAYKSNREVFEAGDLIAVDRQWRTYFESAQKAQGAGTGKWTPSDGVDVLLDGMNAHVIYDMPRAVRFVVSHSKSDLDELTQDFKVSTDLYMDAEQSMKMEILKIFTSAADREDANSLFGNGSEYVKFASQKAWEMGVGKGPLGVLAEQPILEHDTASRKFFPKELMVRGICR